MPRKRSITHLAHALGALVLALAAGCTSVKVTGTPRSGTEQLLLTGTWDAALMGVDFRPLAGERVFLDAERISVVDKDWVISSIRRSMAEQGVLLENSKDKAKVIVEAAFGAYGTDERQRKLGLPGIGLSPSLTGVSVGATSSASALTLSETNQQDAVVKAALFAYEPKTGRMVWESGPLLNAQGSRDHFFGGSGPYRMSSRPEVEQFTAEAQGRTNQRFFHRLFGHFWSHPSTPRPKAAIAAE